MYNCTVCNDLDLCAPCQEKEGHPNKTEKLDLDDDMDSSPDDMNQVNIVESREFSVNRCVRCIQSLDHTSRCRGPNCRLPSCQKMKRAVKHSKICKRKTKGDCHVCEQMVSSYYYHAKQCQEDDCSMPFCKNIKQKMKQQQNKI